MKLVKDLYLVASDSSSAPKGPEGYSLIGYWDVDNGGSHGTGGTTGSYMMALYAKFEEVPLLNNVMHVHDVFLTASSNASPTAPVNGMYHNIGYWDVDKGGAVGTNGSQGHYMMGMYTRSNEGGDQYISDIKLTACDNPFPNILGADSDYTMVGYWDVDNGGSVGTDGSKGHYMMGLFVKYSLV